MTRQGSRTAKLFVRLEPKTGLESRKERVITQLKSLAGRDAIADYDVLAWGKEIRPDGPLQEAAYCRTLREYVDELRAWIDENDVRNCGFEARDVSSRMTGESYDVVTLPAICLGVYEGEKLVDVYPRRNDESYETVDDGLELLASQPAAVTGRSVK
jgi:hypothetical protein